MIYHFVSTIISAVFQNNYNIENTLTVIIIMKNNSHNVRHKIFEVYKAISYIVSRKYS